MFLSLPGILLHYPACICPPRSRRLHELVLVDLPPVLSWMLKGVKQASHPDTRDKFRIVPAGGQVPSLHRTPPLPPAAEQGGRQAP